MSKIAIFYLIGQYGDCWETEFYQKQLDLLMSTGLYHEAQFIDIYVKGKLPLKNIPDKVNNITYVGELEEDTVINRKLCRTYNYIQHRMWEFSQCNPDYKILFFHSLGVSHSDPYIKETKTAWKKYMETLLIENWKECVDLLDYYDCVGTDYISTATYSNGEIKLDAPHYQGFFWWANSNYLKTLDYNYVYQPVIWQSWLCELWIGSGNPNAYNFYASGLNHYYHIIDPPYDLIIDSCRARLNELKLTHNTTI